MPIASNRHSKRFNWLDQWVASAATLGLAVLSVSVLSTTQVVGQTGPSNGYRQTYQPRNHELTRGDMAPGVVADIARMSNPKLEGHVQPVRVITPIGSRVGIRTSNGYVQTNASKTSVGLTVGPVYRFKVTDIPNKPGVELYPSVEILNRLSPPAGLENEFPIQVLITQSDLEEAIEGRMVTKVVYLESPETALPHRHLPDKQPYFDVGGGEDPLRVAERLGRPMAILRVGSRIPMPSDAGERFGFSAPSPTILPDPEPAPVDMSQDLIDPAISSTRPRRAPSVPNAVRPMRMPNAGLPPIVNARHFRAQPFSKSVTPATYYGRR